MEEYIKILKSTVYKYYEDVEKDLVDYKDQKVMYERAVGQRQMLLRLFSKELYTITKDSEGNITKEIIEKRPKFKVGDKVRYKAFFNSILTITSCEYIPKSKTYHYKLKEISLTVAEKDLSLYTKTLKEKYWETGNIFVLNSGSKYLILGKQAVGNYSNLTLDNFTEDLCLIHQDISVSFVYRKEDIKTIDELLSDEFYTKDILWKRSNVLTIQEIKEKFEIKDKLIILEHE